MTTRFPIPHLLAVLAAGTLPLFAQGRGAASGPLPVEAHTVAREPFAETIPTVGTLRANESVSLVPEVSRRLVSIHVEEGSEVEAGQLLFQLDDSDVRSSLEEIEARIRLAAANRDRASSLLPSRAISQQEYEVTLAELAILEAQRNALQVDLEKTSIRAPFGGRVGVRHVSEGAYVSPQTELIGLQDVSRIKVDFPLPERYANDVRVGQTFQFAVAGNGRVFDGTITVIEPAIDPSTRSLMVRGICGDPAGLLPGGFAEVTLVLDELADGFLIPTQALIPSPRGQGVFVIRDGKAELQPVETGIRTSNRVQILRGLDEGDQVAITNLLRLRPGVEVSIVPTDT